MCLAPGSDYLNETIYSRSIRKDKTVCFCTVINFLNLVEYAASDEGQNGDGNGNKQQKDKQNIVT